MAKRSATEIIMYAIRHAVDERESFLDAISHCFEPEYEETRQRVREWIKDMKEYYVNRFGHDPWKEEAEFLGKMRVLQIKSATGRTELVDTEKDKT